MYNIFTHNLILQYIVIFNALYTLYIYNNNNNIYIYIYNYIYNKIYL